MRIPAGAGTEMLPITILTNLKEDKILLLNPTWGTNCFHLRQIIGEFVAENQGLGPVVISLTQKLMWDV